MKPTLPLIIALVLSLAGALGPAAEPPVTEGPPALVMDGKAAFRFAVGRDASNCELLALTELSEYLARITGAGPRYDGGSPRPEGWDDGKEHLIYLGWTEFAGANGLDGAAMLPEEWAVKTVGSNLILTGGRPRGTLYAVYEFLEKECGVRWFDRYTEIVPKNPHLTLRPVDRRGRPAMRVRVLAFNEVQPLLTPFSNGLEEMRFQVRNRCPGLGEYLEGRWMLRNLLYGLAFAKALESPVHARLRRSDSDLGSMVWNLNWYHSGATLEYLTPDFYQTAQRLFDTAEARCAADAGSLLRVRRERLRVDLSMLELWGDLERQLPDGQNLPFDRATVIDRFETHGKAVIGELSWFDKAGFSEALQKEVAYRRAFRLPEQAAGRGAHEVIDITSRYFTGNMTSPANNKILVDPAAAPGKAMVFEGEPGWPAEPVNWKLAGLERTLTPAEFPRDGRYHLLPLGRMHAGGSGQSLSLIAKGKVLGGLDLRTRLNRRDAASEWQAYLSVKMAGPSFTPDSGDKDAIFLERVLLVRPRPGHEHAANETK